MNSRIDIQKTYKLYINGKFSRTESGRYFPLKDSQGKTTVNLCQASRKDFREAVKFARKAVSGWSSRTAYNRGQILYRIAETLEGRKKQFVQELNHFGITKNNATQEVEITIDRLVYYAGWADKYQALFSSVNPVSSAHYNFSVPEYQGVIAIISPNDNPLLGLVSLIAPAFVGGNTIVCLASEKNPLTAITFAEVLHASDIPNGAINILTGFSSELAEHFSSHKDVNGIVYCGENLELNKSIQENASENVKRIHYYDKINWLINKGQSPYFIMDHSEIKTTWHPIGS